MSDGSSIPIPGNAIIFGGVKNGKELIESYRNAREQVRQNLSNLVSTDLGKEFVFTARHYTGIGIIWTIFSYHTYQPW